MIKPICILVFFATLITFNLLGKDKNPDNITYIKPNRQPYSGLKQQELQQQNSWRKFSEKNKSWKALFNEISGLPHRAFGKGISVIPQQNIYETATYFLKNHLNSFNLPLADLKLRNINSSGKYHCVNYYQTYSGLKILNSQLTLRLTKNNEVVLFGMDIYKNIMVNTNPVFSKEEIKTIAISGLEDYKPEVTFSDELKILPVSQDAGYQYHLVYEVYVNTENSSLHGKYYMLLDAHSGEILYRQNQVYSVLPGNISVTTEGTLYKRHPYIPAEITALPYYKVVMGTEAFNADVNGLLDINKTGSLSASIYLEGLWAKVVTGDGGTTPQVMNVTLNEGFNNLSFDSKAKIEQLTAYYHVNQIHDYMKLKIPELTSLDFPMITKVEQTGVTCNANYNGNLNFYIKSNDCNSLCLVSDVVYHEYGHGINYYLYEYFGGYFENGAMGEGYSDVWALGLTENPRLGIGMSTTDSSSVIRRYDIEKKIYPNDLAGEVHADGEIIAGCWWDVGLNLGNVQQMMDLFIETQRATASGPDGDEGRIYTDILLDAIAADDDDGNLANGTPHYSEITNAFANHGITMMTTSTIDNTSPENYEAGEPVSILATLGIVNPQYYGSTKLVYTINNTNKWDTLDMNLASGTEYEAILPAQSVGTIIKYYMYMTDNTGNIVIVSPIGANSINPKLPYYLMIGYILNHQEDFDNISNDWQVGDIGDDARTGIWVIGSPIPSYIATPNTALNRVQTQYDHTTTGNDYNLCAFTANAGNETSEAGTSDVDEGKTTLFSPELMMDRFKEPAISYWRCYSNDMGSNPGNDVWQVFISNDFTNWVQVERTSASDKNWSKVVIKVKDYLSSWDIVSLKFVAQDSFMSGADRDGQSLIEAAIDDLCLYDTTIVPPDTTTNPPDTNQNPKSISENKVLFSPVRILPVPARNYIRFVSTKNNYLTSIKIINSTGQVQYTEKNKFELRNELTIEIKGWEQGMYLAEVKCNDIIIRKKFLVVR